MPEATNIYESTLDKQFRILIAKSVDIYVNAVAAHDSELTGEDDVNRLHASAKDKALKNYEAEKKFGDYGEGANYKRELQKKLEEVFNQWKSVSMNHIRTLQQQKKKTSVQQTQVKQAQVIDGRAKQELENAIKNAEEAKRSLEQARYDTAEARREAEELRKQSVEADKERAVAIEKENQTREWLEKMTKDKEYFEQQYNEYKATASQNVGETLSHSQRENGFSSKF